MENLITKEKSELSTEYCAAVAVHEQIYASAKLAATALSEMAKSLKKMRDEKLYEYLGFKTFGEYVENNQDYCFKERQAYTYIKAYEDLGSKFLQSNAELGITKLELLTKIPAYERQNFIEENNIAGLSVKEIEDLIKEKQELGEQLSLLTEENIKLKKGAADTDAKEISELELKIKTLMNEKERLTDECYNNAQKVRSLEENIEMLKDENADEADEYKSRIAMLEKENKELASKPIEVIEATGEAAEKIKNEAIAEIEKKHASELKKLKKEYEKQIKSERENAEKEKQDFEKKLKSENADEVKIALKMYFEETQKNVTSFIGKLKEIKDPETKRKFLSGTEKWLNMMIAELKEM